MPTQEIQTITKETQKNILKSICESPTLTIDELTSQLKGTLKKISQDEIVQVIHGLSPNKNWHRASEEEIQKEILNYIWTIESEILFLFPAKQKETSVSDFNQLRLQNKQPKVPKDTIRNLQSILMVDGKNLAKFRKFHKELSIQADLDINIQAMWLARIVLANLSLDTNSEVQHLSQMLSKEISEKFPTIAEKTGKTLQRICERFIDKYFPKKISGMKLKELVNLYQTSFNTYKQASESESSNQAELKDQNKIIESITEQLKEVEEIINESHEGGFISKLFSGKVKNKEGIIKKIEDVIAGLNEITELSNKANKSITDKSFLVQKIQSDYDNVIFIKNQLEHDLLNLNEKTQEAEEKNLNLEKELKDKSESLDKLQGKIVSLQQKVDEIPEMEEKLNVLREDLTTAKTISISLYSRIQKMKDELSKQKSENENSKPRLQNGNGTTHKFKSEQENEQSSLHTTEISPN